MINVEKNNEKINLFSIGLTNLEHYSGNLLHRRFVVGFWIRFKSFKSKSKLVSLVSQHRIDFKPLQRNQERQTLSRDSAKQDLASSTAAEGSQDHVLHGEKRHFFMIKLEY